MLQTAEKPKSDLWDLLSDLEPDAQHVGVIAHLLFQTISEQEIGKPLPDQNHEVASWLINELMDIGDRLNRKVEGLYEVNAANKKVAA